MLKKLNRWWVSAEPYILGVALLVAFLWATWGTFQMAEGIVGRDHAHLGPQ